MSDVDLRLDRLESTLAVHRLISQYAHAFDSQDLALLRSIWHDGAELRLGEPFGDFAGIDGIVEAAHLLWSQSPRMHHWMSNVVVDLGTDGDDATAISALDCLVTNVELGPTQVGGVYRDRFERRDGRWGLTERVFDLHYFTPIPNWTPAHGSETAPLVVPSR
ncbi:nuclear transport factor 2 family protein [Pseudonocardia kujensis]|uniref:nuclear transport factor 2 family protein n=1 Tax=Pseudonocardia kujensis TaxID=1128675 RepID=UPI001E284033|nr:nuclear transport factor 2 family protein [Pseudonocardia kujensis]MCE0764238.1 nuclear transport factor 2 family protein [Pseudonocardia kujensis]